MTSSTMRLVPINDWVWHRLMDAVLHSAPVSIHATDSEPTQTSSTRRAPEKDGQQCAPLRHLRKDTDGEESCSRPKTHAPLCHANVHGRYSLRRRYTEPRGPLQDCGCEEDLGETALVAILLLLSPPSERAAPLQNCCLSAAWKGLSALLKPLKVTEACGPYSSPSPPAPLDGRAAVCGVMETMGADTTALLRGASLTNCSTKILLHSISTYTQTSVCFRPAGLVRTRMDLLGGKGQ